MEFTSKYLNSLITLHSLKTFPYPNTLLGFADDNSFGLTMSSLPIIPSDLIIEILSWLPANSLVRFRRVSKYWKSLISNTTFAKLHLQRSPKRTHTLLTSSNNFRYSVLIPYSVSPLLEHPSSILVEDECRRFKNYEPLVIGSANGLVCLIGDISSPYYNYEFSFRFWNPTLRLVSKNSPILIIPPDDCNDFEMPHLGFGYDDLNDTYKVVAVFWNPTTQEMEGRVHCMGDSCWRKIIACPSFPILRCDNLIGPFVSGNVNWLALHNSKGHKYEWENVTINQLTICSLDLQKETCKYMLLPDCYKFHIHCKDKPSLAVLRGRLCFYYDYMRTHFVLWEMREFGVQESWTRLVNVSYAHLQIKDPDSLLVPMCLSENGDVLMLANNNQDDVIKYNQRDNRIEYVELPNNQIFYAHEHMQSLVLPRPCPN